MADTNNDTEEVCIHVYDGEIIGVHKDLGKDTGHIPFFFSAFCNCYRDQFVTFDTPIGRFMIAKESLN